MVMSFMLLGSVNLSIAYIYLVLNKIEVFFKKITGYKNPVKCKAKYCSRHSLQVSVASSKLDTLETAFIPKKKH